MILPVACRLRQPEHEPRGSPDGEGEPVDADDVRLEAEEKDSRRIRRRATPRAARALRATQRSRGRMPSGLRFPRRPRARCTSTRPPGSPHPSAWRPRRRCRARSPADARAPSRTPVAQVLASGSRPTRPRVGRSPASGGWPRAHGILAQELELLRRVARRRADRRIDGEKEGRDDGGPRRARTAGAHAALREREHHEPEGERSERRPRVA